MLFISICSAQYLYMYNTSLSLVSWCFCWHKAISMRSKGWLLDKCWMKKPMTALWTASSKSCTFCSICRKEHKSFSASQMESAVKEANWMIKVSEELEKMEGTATEMQHWQKRSIYKLPACITDLNDNAYKPQAVSFGPYHNGKPHLMPMEEHKRRALINFLKRSSKPLSLFVESLAEVVQDIKDSYHPLDSQWDDNENILQLMILDGCFMLEIMKNAHASSDDDDNKMDGYALNDPVFSKHGELHIMPYVRRDMLILENQLPMLVLEKLVETESNGVKKGEYLNQLIQKFVSPGTRMLSLGKCLHVLDVFRKSQIKQGPSKATRDIRKRRHKDSNNQVIRSATELTEAGIQFKKSKTTSLRDISFHKGILRLPVILVDDVTDSNLLNMIAFERLHVGAGNEVTSYVFFMDNIIDNERDIALLHNKGIVQNAIGSDKAAADLFNSLSKDTTLDPESKLGVVHEKVNRYCKKRWNKWRANLCHTYFTNPWAIVSLIAAILLFALTIVQTYYTIYSYYQPS